MRRVLMILATLGILCVAANQVQAHDYRHGYGYGYGGYYYRGYYGGPMIRPPVWARSPVVVPVPVYPRPLYPRVYGYPSYYYPGPSAGFYYQSPGLSIGVGF